MNRLIKTSISILTLFLVDVSGFSIANAEDEKFEASPQTILYAGSLNITLREGDSILENCRDEFDPTITFTEEDLEGLQCIAPAEGNTRDSFIYYKAQLEAAGFASASDKPQNGPNYALKRGNERVMSLILSYRYFNRALSDDDAANQEDGKRILASLPIGFFYVP